MDLTAISSLFLFTFLLPLSISLEIEAGARTSPNEVFHKPSELTPIHQSRGDLYQHDMMLAPFQRDILEGNSRGQKNPVYRWAEGDDGFPTVPYQIMDSTLNSAVAAGIAHWEEHTCVKFQLKESSYNESQIKFIRDNGCWSYVGYIGFISQFANGQEVSIGDGCESLHTVVHEIGHALGLFHEQSRPDRDDYIRVLLENVEKDAQSNFDKQLEKNVEYYNVKYDYTSVMQYGTYFFTNNNLPTMLTVDPFDQTLITEENALTHRNKLLVNNMYGCLDKWEESCGADTVTCQNDGYMDSNCSCVCPPGTTGDLCQNVNQDYYENVRSSCVREINSEGQITFNDFPAQGSTEYSSSHCITRITSPNCTLPKLTLVTSDDNVIYVSQSNISDFIRLTSDPGNPITAGTNEMVIMQDRYQYASTWVFDVTFVPAPDSDEDCSTSMPSTVTTTQPTTTTTTTTPQNMTTETCGVETIGDTIQWTSPGFNEGIAYPNDFTCTISNNATEPKLTEYTLNDFNLERKRKKKCSDMVSILYPDSSYLRLCRTKLRKIKVPMSNYLATFSTDEKRVYGGFSISISQRTTNCHRLLDYSDGSKTSGRLQSPRFPKKYLKRTKCEYWVMAPADKTIQVQFNFMKIRKSNNCYKSYVAVDTTGDGWYRRDTTTRVCGRDKPSIVTTGPKLTVAFDGGVRRNKGWRLTYTFI